MEPETAPKRPPTTVIAAVAIVAIELADAALAWWRTSSREVSLQALALGLALVALLGFTLAGRRVARDALVAALGIGVAWAAWRIATTAAKPEFGDATPEAGDLKISLALRLVAIALLFSRRSRPWFEAAAGAGERDRAGPGGASPG